MSTIEDQPTPEEIAESKRAYMRRYMQERRKSRPDVRAKESAYSAEYMRSYRQTPQYAAQREAIAERAKAAAAANPKPVKPTMTPEERTAAQKARQAKSKAHFATLKKRTVKEILAEIQQKKDERAAARLAKASQTKDSAA